MPPLREAGLGIADLSVINQSGVVTVSVDVAGPREFSESRLLARRLAVRTNRPTTLILRWTKRDETVEVARP